MAERRVYTGHKFQTFFVMSVGVAACGAAGYTGYKEITEESISTKTEYNSKLLGWREDNEGFSIRLGDVALDCMQEHGVSGLKNIRPNPENPAHQTVVIRREGNESLDVMPTQSCIQNEAGFNHVAVTLSGDDRENNSPPGEEFWQYVYQIRDMIDEALGEINR